MPKKQNESVPGKRIGGDDLSRVKIVSIAPPQLGEAAYHGKIGEFLRGVAPHSEATDAAVLGQLLPAIGILIGPGPTYYTGQRQPPRVNSVIVGETNSGRKGTAAAPVDELMSRVDPEFWMTQRVGGLSSGEGLIVKVSDTKDEDGNYFAAEKRLYVLEEEFSRVLANMRREGNILSHIIRQAFDTGMMGTLTVNPRQAFGAHISIVAHITPDELAERFQGIECANGFGNRFLWFYVASDKVIPRPTPFPDSVFQAIVPQLRAIARMKDRNVGMTDAAGKQWEAEYVRLREDRPGIAGALTARGPALVLRLALTYAIVDRPKKPAIGPEHLNAALAVWKYNCDSVEMLFDSKTGDKLKDKLYLMVKTHGQMTRSGFNRHLSNEQKRKLEGALQSLAEAKVLQSKKVSTKGRPIEVWTLAAESR